ncbi:purine-cytosine permease related protein [Secundilactobacillus kimchicus JCM 15530]|uniref:Purine-cytosine permease related protein n=1 Tax=Secundilactobacillus kimchicus JCM 15530 TaxID=1302272 RepID=A0A0R1HR47_9LACO|nr:cytosine permease [Secundilactobacillus kimchicus]KRK48911.1 purine-cytosine permease related protein [Secundilactobacillus kimchicus JCM 15530]
MAQTSKLGRVEAIPMTRRHMSYWDMFATWVGANANNGTWYIGGVIAACGFMTASTTLIISGILAYLLLAAASYMGYKTGLPAMTLTRASFGIRGSWLPSLINLVQFIGWAAVNTFIAAQSMSYLFNDLFGWPVFGHRGGVFGLIVGILIMSVFHLLSVSVGQRSVQLIERVGIVLVFVFVIWETIVVFKTVSFHQILAWRPPHSLAMTPGAAMDVLAAFSLAWVTAGSDFSRFTSRRQNATGAAFWGANLGLLWFAFIGVVATIGTAITLRHFDPNNSDPSTIASRLGLGALAMVVIVLTSTTANAVNLMSAGSALTNMTHRLNLKVSLWIVTIVATIVTFVPIIAASFLTVFTAFLDGIGMVLGPEIGVFLVDFFVIKKRQYQLSAFGDPTGPYWYRQGFNWMALGVWFVSVIAYLGLKHVAFIADTVGSTFITILLSMALYYIGMTVIQNQAKANR